MATHSGILAFRIPWTEEPGGLPSTGVTKSTTTEAMCTQPGPKPCELPAAPITKCPKPSALTQETSTLPQSWGQDVWGQHVPGLFLPPEAPGKSPVGRKHPWT